MRTVSYKLADLGKVVIHLGKMAENDATQVRIDAAEVFSEYPNAVPALDVINPSGEAYTVEVTLEGTVIVWDVKDSSLTAEGNGEIQLTFTQDGTKVKSSICRTKVCRSITGGGTAPDPVQDWLDHANEVLEETGNALETLENMTASASSLPAGSNPTATYQNGNIAFGIPKGDKGDTGAAGQDGVTPNVTAGTTTTGAAGTSASVTRRAGSPDSAPIFDFTIPKGDKGDHGDLQLDSTLTSASAAAPADQVGNLKSALQLTNNNFNYFISGEIKTNSSQSGLYMSGVNNVNKILSAGSGQVIYYAAVNKGEKYRIYVPQDQLFDNEYIAVGFGTQTPAADVSVTVIEMGSTTEKVINAEFVAPSNGYIYVSKSRVTTNYYIVKLTNELTDLAQNYIKKYTFDTHDGYFNSAGVVQTQTSDKEKYTDKMTVYEGEKLYWYFTISDGTIHSIWVACMYYDASQNVVGTRNALVAVNNFSAKGSFTVPHGVAYVAFTYRTFNLAHTFSVNGSYELSTFNDNATIAENLNRRVQTDFTNSKIKSVNHRGYNSVAPENTLPAFKLSKENGFGIVETDIRFTSDNVPVLLHDSTVDRTSNGTGSIYEMTYSQARELDFGSWKSETYAGTKIPSFKEFLTLCKKINLYAYCELETPMTQAQVESLIAIAKECGMLDKITWISFSLTLLGYVVATEKTARVGALYSSGYSASAVLQLYTGYNEVFVDHDVLTITESIITSCITNGLPLEVWTIDTESGINELNVYVSGVTSDNLIAEKVMYDNEMN